MDGTCLVSIFPKNLLPCIHGSLGFQVFLSTIVGNSVFAPGHIVKNIALIIFPVYDSQQLRNSCEQRKARIKIRALLPLCSASLIADKPTIKPLQGL